LAVTNWLQSNLEENNIYGRSVYQRNLKTANELAISISEELESRNK